MASFAAETRVPIENSIGELRRTIERFKGGQFVYGISDEQLVAGFTKDARQVRFYVRLGKDKQKNRALARALLLVVKAKLVAVDSGVATFEDEFLANIVLPDGGLVGQQVKPAIAAAYDGRSMPPLLPDYSA
jgi:hypothetical protein